MRDITTGFTFRSTGPSGNIWRVVARAGDAVTIACLHSDNDSCDPEITRRVRDIEHVLQNGRAEETTWPPSVPPAVPARDTEPA